MLCLRKFHLSDAQDRIRFSVLGRQPRLNNGRVLPSHLPLHSPSWSISQYRYSYVLLTLIASPASPALSWPQRNPIRPHRPRQPKQKSIPSSAILFVTPSAQRNTKPSTNGSLHALHQRYGAGLHPRPSSHLWCRVMTTTMPLLSGHPCGFWF